MKHITSELLNSKNLSLWLITVAMLAFASGYSLASFQNGGAAEGQGQKSSYLEPASGKYGHLTFQP